MLMDVAGTGYATVCLWAFLPILLAWCYRSFWKPYKGLPTSNYAYHLWRLCVTGGFPKNLPATGCFLSYHNALSNLFRKEGLFVGWCGQFYLSVFGADATKFFITDPAAKEKGRAYNLMKICLGEGLLTCNGKTSSQRKKIILPALHAFQFKRFTTIFNLKSIEVVERLRKEAKGPYVGLVELLEKEFFEIAFDAVIGNDFLKGVEQATLDECRVAILELGDFTISRWFKPWLFFDPILGFFPEGFRMIRKADMCKKVLIKATETFMKSPGCQASGVRKDERTPNKLKPLSQLLNEAHQKDPKAFTLKDVTDELTTMIVAAYHTTVMAAFWTIYLLGLHPDIQENVFDEVSAKMSEELSSNDVQDMPYMESVIKESMRLYPPVPAIVRHLEEGVRFSEYAVPPGTDIIFWIYMLHRDPSVFPNPEVFDPSRFGPDKKEDFGRFHYMPFAEGPRTCIGKAFSMVELKVLLFHIVRNFKIVSLDSRDRVQLTWNVVLLPVEKPRIQFIPRSIEDV